VDFQKEALLADSEGYIRIGLNDPIRYPGVNLHPCNFGIYDREAGLILYIPDHIKNIEEYYNSLISALENTITAEV
jgi:hypothetical protein